MRKTMVAVAALALAGLAFAAGRETQTKVGAWTAKDGRELTFLIVQPERGLRFALIHASDEHAVDQVLFRVNSEDIAKIEALLAETRAELLKN